MQLHSKFYSTVVRCEFTDRECPGAVNNWSTGWIPRGFYSEARPGFAKLLLVAKNPGHPTQEETSGLYAHDDPEQLAQATLGLAGRMLSLTTKLVGDEKASQTFHKNLRRYVSYWLDVPPEKIFQVTAYTNLVKCSTRGERDTLSSSAMTSCFQKHFVREIQYFNPKLIVAFGREVERFLLRPDIQAIHNREVIYVKHPSYFYAKSAEGEILAGIKQRIKARLDQE